MILFLGLLHWITKYDVNYPILMKFLQHVMKKRYNSCSFSCLIVVATGIKISQAQNTSAY